MGTPARREIYWVEEKVRASDSSGSPRMGQAGTGHSARTWRQDIDTEREREREREKEVW